MKRPPTPETQFLSAQDAVCVVDHEPQTRIKSDVQRRQAFIAGHPLGLAQGLSRRRVRDDFAVATPFLSLAA
ncbi:hypothetical protein LP417_12015 [Polaromonas sp. P1-6]|nr:hypothetical protein LP417_12015 [Polaromonas sp. P1-6]